MVPSSAWAAARTVARVLRARYGACWRRARDLAREKAARQAARSGAGVIPELGPLEVTRMVLDKSKLLAEMCQRMYAVERGAEGD